jgi:plasmid stabilization system protein ParE
LVWRLRLTADAQADLREITAWLSQPGSGAEAIMKLDALKAGLRGLRRDPLRHPVFHLTGGRKCSTRGGYEIHYDVLSDPPGSTTSGVIDVVFVKSPYQDYSTFLG